MSDSRKMQNIDDRAEEILMALAFSHPEDIFTECDWLSGDMFGTYRHQKIYCILQEAYKAKKLWLDGIEISHEISEMMVSAELFEFPEDVHSYFNNLYTHYSYPLKDMAYCATTVFDLYKKRRILAVNADFAAKSSQADGTGLNDILFRFKKELEEIEALNISQKEPLSVPADTILNTDWPEPVWVVEKMLPTGLGFIGGKPKGGKSWLMLQLAWCVGTGAHFLGYKTNKGKVLYMALEDSKRRLKSRMKKQGWTNGTNVRFMTLEQFDSRIGNLSKGGGRKLVEIMKDDLFNLIIIDTQARAFGGNNQFDPSEVLDVLSPIQKTAIELNTTVLFVDHMPKLTGANKDIISDLYGSVAKVGVADTLLGLYRDRGQTGATLSVLGREVIEFDLNVTVDWDTGTWSAESPLTGMKYTEARFKILEALMDDDYSLPDLSNELDRNKGSLNRDLNDLKFQGLVLEQKQGRKRMFQASAKGREVHPQWKTVYERQTGF